MILDDKAMEHLLRRGVVFTFRMTRKSGIENWFGSGSIIKNGNPTLLPNKIDVVVEEVGEVDPKNELIWYLKDSGFHTLEEWHEEIKEQYNVLSGFGEKSDCLPERGWLYKIIYFKEDEKDEKV
ncbi:MAG: hypothetical protein ACUVXA_10485 [Candidatus Jordarchaeum sp.]|uniref:hypothetical protein n=1 Tax=Candidatus Jordarchaeum sp. TaxID=2823881 RepID=UPI00404B1DC0